MAECKTIWTLKDLTTLEEREFTLHKITPPIPERRQEIQVGFNGESIVTDFGAFDGDAMVRVFGEGMSLADKNFIHNLYMGGRARLMRLTYTRGEDTPWVGDVIFTKQYRLDYIDGANYWEYDIQFKVMKKLNPWTLIQQINISTLASTTSIKQQISITGLYGTSSQLKQQLQIGTAGLGATQQLKQQINIQVLARLISAPLLMTTTASPAGTVSSGGPFTGGQGDTWAKNTLPVVAETEAKFAAFSRIPVPSGFYQITKEPTMAGTGLATQEYTDIAVFDGGVNQAVLMANRGGALFRSMNKGITWDLAHAIPTNLISTVQFTKVEARDAYGYAAGPGGSFYKSSDYGLTWTAYPINAATVNWLYRLKTAALDQNILASDFFRVHRSGTNGNTWDTYYTATTAAQNQIVGFTVIGTNVGEGKTVVLSKNTGQVPSITKITNVFGGVPGVIVTTGITGTTVDDEVSCIHAHSEIVAEGSTAMIVGAKTGGKIWKTVDGGTTWAAHTPAGAIGEVTSVIWPDATNASLAYLVCTDGITTKVLKNTVASLDSWTVVLTTTSLGKGLKIESRGVSDIYVLGHVGATARTKDAGVTWTLTQLEPTVKDLVYCIDAVPAPASTRRTFVSTGFKGYIEKYVTEVLGTSPKLGNLVFALPVKEWINCIHAVTYDKVWCCGTNGFVGHMASDAVTEVAPLTAPADIHLFGVHFHTDNLTGWVVGEGGAIYKTTNNGTSWALQTSSVTDELRAVHFLDANTGWVVGAGGKILKTTNGGTAWALQTSGTTRKLFSVYFFDANTGYACGENIMLKTVNGGTTWTAVGALSGYVILDVEISALSSAIAWAVTLDGKVLKTTDTGVTWAEKTVTHENPDGYKRNYGISFPSAQDTVGFLVTEGGKVLMTNDTTGVEVFTPTSPVLPGTPRSNNRTLFLKVAG